MIPHYTRVIAIDDDENHLKDISWGLSKAGFSPIPFYFEDGRIENPPITPLPNVRVIFTDIHMVSGAMSNSLVHANNILKSIKKIATPGPYVLIFWSKYPSDSEQIKELIQERAGDYAVTLPIGFATIDKNAVFNAANGTEADFEALRDLILSAITSFKTLAVATSWEDRAGRAIAKTTNRLYELVSPSSHPAEDWERLLAYLAVEAVGKSSAVNCITGALDTALIPLLEDQLFLLGSEPSPPEADVARLLELVTENVTRPASVSAPRLNASYLIEVVDTSKELRASSRGMVSRLGSSFVNSGPFIRAFGTDSYELIKEEFLTSILLDDTEIKKLKLHIVELGSECDHVQGKISTQRYLLALMIPASIIWAFNNGKKPPKVSGSPRYKNESILDIGQFSLNSDISDHHLLISTRCFMSLAPQALLESVPQFRLRRSTLEEVVHRYTSHARRPGVMRFKN